MSSALTATPAKRSRRIPPALRLAQDRPQTAPTALVHQDVPPTPAPPKPKPVKNLKRLALAIPPPDPAAAILDGSLSAVPPPVVIPSPVAQLATHPPPARNPSIVSLPATAPAAKFRKEEDGSPTAPYPDGPVEVMPRVWIGTDDHARDWKGLRERGIRSIVNVAKELVSPFESASTLLRSTYSASDIARADTSEPRPIYYPANLQSGRPAFHYLKMPWSHGQANLVKQGFPVAMDFIDKALQRGDGVLIHCQCGVSRSATLTIALVMRAAANSNASTPPEIADLKGGGMHTAYAFVKSKSKWVGPNMSLIYQLLDYERVFQSGQTSPSSSVRSSQPNEEEEEWGRQRLALEAAESPVEAESDAFFNEAKALDLEMEERNVARKVSQSSFASVSSTGHGMGTVWKSRYGFGSVGRARTGSTSSNLTNRSSTLSEELPEEEEEEEDQSVTGDANKLSPSTAATDEDTHQWTQELTIPSDFSRGAGPQITFALPPPSAPVSKVTFNLPGRSNGGSKGKAKYRPSPLTGLLPPVPSSPVPATAPIQEVPVSKLPGGSDGPQPLPVRRRTESRRPVPPPLHLRPPTRPRGQGSISSLSSTTSSVVSATPSQTLFVFPPSPTSHPSTMMLTATQPSFLPFPSLSTPRVASMTRYGRTRSYIGLGAPPTPTTAFSIVEVRGTINTPTASSISRSFNL